MITSGDLLLILFLIFLEAILSIDNALVLALLARKLPPGQQRKALTYGMIGAIGFRLFALLLITQLLHWHWIKFIGGGYLIFIAMKHFLYPTPENKSQKQSKTQFWRVVLSIELTDIAFALDSILAAVALTQKFWVVFTGGVLGILMMRFAANLLIKILYRFPFLENTAYFLVFLIGAKVTLEGFQLPQIEFDSVSHPAFWVFWGSMFLCILYGFRPAKKPGLKIK